MVRPSPSLALLSLLAVACALGAPATVRADPPCHDELWEEGEFCGYDAYVTTGVTEMNHDCLVDIMDLQLFRWDFLTGLGDSLGGDFTGDGRCDIIDLAVFEQSWADPVPGCTVGGMLPDVHQGSIALSFSEDPFAIVSSTILAPGEEDTVFVVIDGHGTACYTLEYALETSPNLPMEWHWEVYDPWVPPLMVVDPDDFRCYRAIMQSNPLPPGPIVIGGAVIRHTDDEPGWIRLVDFAEPGFPPGYLRWISPESDQSFYFDEISDAEVLGGAPMACHDGQWDEGEFCGHDAYVTTGVTEMNHDCLVDMMDLQLLLWDFLTGFGDSLGGDFNGDGICNLLDIVTFVPSWAEPVPGCTVGGMEPDVYQGSMTLSFSDDPFNIVPGAALEQGVIDTIYCVIDGYPPCNSVELAFETSPNLPMLWHWGFVEPWYEPLMVVNPDSFQCYRAVMSATALPPAPMVIAGVAVHHTDDEAGWIHLTEFHAPDWPPGYLRCISPESDQSFFFDEISHAEILPSTSAVGEGVSLVARRPALYDAVPNPFRPSTTIPFALGAPGRVELAVYDVAGRVARRLVEGELAGGRHEIVWDGRDDRGRIVPAGIYFYELVVGGRTVGVRKAVVMR